MLCPVLVLEKMVPGSDDLHRFLAAWPVGESVKLIVIRGKERLELSVVPGEAA
ncbi:MAG: hypothetical protein R3F37_20215 [Candidatus Competibacteraceae bacterium]